MYMAEMAFKIHEMGFQSLAVFTIPKDLLVNQCSLARILLETVDAIQEGKQTFSHSNSCCSHSDYLPNKLCDMDNTAIKMTSTPLCPGLILMVFVKK